MKDTLQFFQSRKETYEAAANKLESQSKSISAYRIATAAAAIILIVIAANNGQSALLAITLIAAMVVFIALIKKHNGVKRNLANNKALQQVNANEVCRAEGKMSELFDGKSFYNARHPYHEDLDLFGRHSLFQLLNRSSTDEGATRLAEWMSSAADLKEVKARQKAVEELSHNIDFRQKFEAQKFVESDDESNKTEFLNWLKQPLHIKNAAILKLLLFIMPLATIGTIIGSSLGYVQAGLPLLLVLVNMLIIGTLFNRLMGITKATEEGFQLLGSLKEHLLLLESENFTSPMLSQLKSQTMQQDKKASSTLSELKFLLDTLHNRSNMMYIVFDVLLLLDVYWLLKIVLWKKNNELELSQWFEVVAQLDALNSIAGFSFANAEFIFPEVNEKEFFIEAKTMGHPLILATKRVSNDFNFQGKGGICLITGSNMSGKSTFLRTLGTNIVLAQMGAPVCATSMEIGQMRVFTSMRTKDELEESVSSFYAELKRLKQLIQSIDNEAPTLFMIDEVLKGTNSDDRHKGALALIRQLNGANAFGLVSTHDLVLGNITNELKGVKNYSFNSQVNGAEISFDYQLTDGICQSFNASQLMKNMGIQIAD